MAQIKITTDDLRLRVDNIQLIIDTNNKAYSKVKAANSHMKNGLTPLLRNNMIQKSTCVMNNLANALEALITGKSILQEVIAAYEDADVVLKGKVDKIPKAVVDWTKGPKGDEVNGATTVTVTDEKRNEILDANIPVAGGIKFTEFTNRLNKLQNEPGFRQGDQNHLNFMNWIDSYKNQPIGGAQCFAMAHMMQVEIYGKRGDPLYNVGFENIQVGDALNYVSSDTNQYCGHWVLVTEVRENSIIVAEGNIPDGSGLVSYGREISKSDLFNIKRIDRVS